MKQEMSFALVHRSARITGYINISANFTHLTGDRQQRVDEAADVGNSQRSHCRGNGNPSQAEPYRCPQSSQFASPAAENCRDFVVQPWSSITHKAMKQSRSTGISTLSVNSGRKYKRLSSVFHSWVQHLCTRSTFATVHRR